MKRSNKNIVSEIISYAIVTVILAVSIALCFIKYIDHRGDELCRTGAWQGEKLCPPERSKE